MKIPSGTTNRYIYFVAVDSGDFVTRETGLTTFTVYYEIANGTATAMTTPTVTEADATNMPGVYSLLIDESGMTTLTAGHDTAELVLHITQASMAPVTRVIEIYRVKATEGNTLDVTSTGAAGIDWNNIENPTTAVNLSGTNIDTDQVVASVSGAVGSVTGAVGSVTGAVGSVTGAVGSVTGNVGGNVVGSVASVVGAVGSVTGAVGSVTGNVGGIAGTITTLDALDTAQDTQHAATQSLIGNLSVGSSGISTVASSFVKSGAEPETNTYTSTQQLDGAYHIVEDVTNATDAYYQFNVGPNGVPVEVEWTGYAQGNNATYAIYFYNWAGVSWDQVGTVTGSAGTTVQSEPFIATVNHVGTGANDGLVRLRFLSADGSAFATDRILCTYSVVAENIGYENGGVWVDEAAGTSSGTTPGVDGLVTNRSDDFDNAQTIATALGYTSIYVTNGNSITLSATINNFVLGVVGGNWTVALGGQDISNCDINDADVSGISTGTTPHFHNCRIAGATTVPPCVMYDCGWGATVTVGSAGDYEFINCHSEVAGSSAPTFDLGAAVGATTASFRRWSGGLTLNNMQAGDVVSVDVVSGGTITVNGTGGAVSIRGMCNVVDGSSGSVTITQTTVLNQNSIADAVWDEARSGHVTQGTYGESFGVIVKGTVSNAVTTPSTTEFAADDITEATGSHYNGRTIIFTTGVLAGQATDITAYSLVSGEGKFTVTALTEAPANNDQFIII